MRIPAFLRPRVCHFAAFLLLIASLSGCQNPSREPIGGPLRVQIPRLKDGRYEIQTIELKTIEDLQRLKGKAARFYMDPMANPKDLTGEAPTVGFFRTKDGSYVARDSLSLQLITLYAYFEKLYFFDVQMGIAELNDWPRKVGINAMFADESGLHQNNAFYISSLDVFIFVPFTTPDLPLMVNEGVVAHEHFHSLFNKKVMKPLDKKYPSSMEKDRHHAVLMRGVNEGLADVWGWVFSKDFDFVGRSLPSERMARRLDFDVRTVFARDEYTKALIGESPAVLSYKVGTVLARAIYGLRTEQINKFSRSEDELRLSYGQAVIKMTDSIHQLLLNTDLSTERIIPSHLLKLFYDGLSSPTASECRYLRDLVKDDEIKEKFACQP